MALDGLKRRIMGSVGLLKGKRKVDEETARELSRSLRKALLEADFNVRQSKELTERIERRMLEEEPRPGVKLDTHAMNLIYTELGTTQRDNASQPDHTDGRPVRAGEDHDHGQAG